MGKNSPEDFIREELTKLFDRGCTRECEFGEELGYVRIMGETLERFDIGYNEAHNLYLEVEDEFKK